MRIGLVPLSGKPVHAGHVGLIKIASRENDHVLLFVSLSDRKRPGEVTILGSDMEKIWKGHIEPTLPGNVSITYTSGGSPVRYVYETIGKANEEGSEDTYVIYSDPVDIEHNYPERNLEKYAGDLYAKGRIILEPIQRTETVDVSGTKMRAWLASGDKESFVSHLPPGIDGDAVWDTLSKPATQPTPKARRKLR